MTPVRYTRLTMTDLFVIGFLVFVAVVVFTAVAAGQPVSFHFRPHYANLDPVSSPYNSRYGGDQLYMRENFGFVRANPVSGQSDFFTTAWGGTSGGAPTQRPGVYRGLGDCFAFVDDIWEVTDRYLVHAARLSYCTWRDGNGAFAGPLHVWRVDGPPAYVGTAFLSVVSIRIDGSVAYVYDGFSRWAVLDLTSVEDDPTTAATDRIVRIADYIDTAPPFARQSSIRGKTYTLRTSGSLSVDTRGQVINTQLITLSETGTGPVPTMGTVVPKTGTPLPEPTGGPCVPRPCHQIGFQCTDGCRELPCPCGTVPTVPPTFTPAPYQSPVPPTPCLDTPGGRPGPYGLCYDCMGETIGVQPCIPPTRPAPTMVPTLSPTAEPTLTPTDAPIPPDLTAPPSNTPIPTQGGGTGGKSKTALWVILGVLVAAILVAVLGRKKL